MSNSSKETTIVVNHVGKFTVDANYWQSLLDNGLTINQAFVKASQSFNSNGVSFDTTIFEETEEAHKTEPKVAA
jgi:hypothetical protein